MAQDTFGSPAAGGQARSGKSSSLMSAGAGGSAAPASTAAGGLPLPSPGVGIGRKGIAPPVASLGDFDFNLGNTKAKVLKSLDDHAPAQFRKFYNSALMDRLLQTCLKYLTAKFQHEWVVASMDRSRKQHLDGYNPYMVVQRIRELEAEMNAVRLELSPLYSLILLKHASYTKPQQDRKFFEALYEAVIGVMDDAFDRLKRRPDIERDLNALFRSKHFNTAERKYQPPRSVDTLGVKELYALKHETANRALNARMLSSLFDKPPTLHVTVASVTNSPLISQAVMSPIVARSKMKDPEERASMLKTVPTPTHKAARRSLGNIFRSAATWHGVNTERLAANITSGKLAMSDTASIGVMQKEKVVGNRRAAALRAAAALGSGSPAAASDATASGSPGGGGAGPGLGGMTPGAGAMTTTTVSAHTPFGPASNTTPSAAPELMGLPVDDTFQFLSLMKRYVTYGPSLGFVNGAPPGGGGPAASPGLSSGTSPGQAAIFSQGATLLPSVPPTASPAVAGPALTARVA